jgi:hypothetical protein
MQEQFAGKKAVQKLLEGHSFLNLDKKLFPVMVGETRLWVDTTLDMEFAAISIKGHECFTCTLYRHCGHGT